MRHRCFRPGVTVRQHLVCDCGDGTIFVRRASATSVSLDKTSTVSKGPIIPEPPDPDEIVPIRRYGLVLTGTQVINTGYAWTEASGTELAIEMDLEMLGGRDNLFSNGGTSVGLHIFRWTSTFAGRLAGQTTDLANSFDAEPASTGRCRVRVTVNEATKRMHRQVGSNRRNFDTLNTFTFTGTAYRTADFFVGGTGGVSNRMTGTIYGFSIRADGVLVRNFIPVPAGSTQYSSTPAPANCMWCSVTERYYTQAAGGETFGIVDDD